MYLQRNGIGCIGECCVLSGSLFHTSRNIFQEKTYNHHAETVCARHEKFCLVSYTLSVNFETCILINALQNLPPPPNPTLKSGPE